MWRPGLLVLLILASGCAGAFVPQDSPVTPAGSAATTTSGPSTTTTPPPATTTETPTPPPATTAPTQTPTDARTTTDALTTTTVSSAGSTDNPWGKSPVVVAVENEAGNAHLRYDQFRAALDYWEANAQQYAGYEVGLVLDPDAESPDVTIRYVETIEQCGDSPPTGSTLGCAPLYRSGEVPEHTVVQIRENDDDVQLVATTKHEFGHVLGIGHGEEPMPLMAENDLYLHASPWNRSAIRYTYDFSDRPGFSETYLVDHVDPAFRYFEGGADGTLDSSPEFIRVGNRSESNIVVEFHADARDGTGIAGSVRRGFEGTIEGESYARYTVALYDLDPDAMAWHVASLLVEIFRGEDDEVPEVLDPDACDYQCRRGDWWT